MRAFIVIFSSFLFVLFVLLEPFSIYFEERYKVHLISAQSKAIKFSRETLSLIYRETNKLVMKFDLKKEPVSVVVKPIELNSTKRNELNLAQIVQPKGLNLTELKQNLSENLALKSADQNLTRTRFKPLNLDANSTLILIGDSMMNGLSWGIESLLKGRKIKIKNLAKSSTGLVNKKFYDWAARLDLALQDEAAENIVLIVLFGANDGYNYTFSSKALRFGTPEWLAAYKERVEEIYAVARKYELTPVWLGLPCMREERFEIKMHALNKVYEATAQDYEAKFISLNEALCDADGKFMKFDEAKRPLRDNDGIHLNINGAKRAAAYIYGELMQE